MLTPLRRSRAPCEVLTASYAATLNLGSKAILHGTATLQYGPDAQNWRDDSLLHKGACLQMPGIATAGRKRPQTHKGALHRPAAEWQNTLLDTHQP